MIACEYAGHIPQAQLIKAVCLLGHVRNQVPQKTNLRNQIYIFKYRSPFMKYTHPGPSGLATLMVLWERVLTSLCLGYRPEPCSS